MTWVRWLFVLAVSVFALSASAQQPQKRVALVIGNAAYATPGWELKNPRSIARARLSSHRHR
jgi:hypothetical protein